MKIQIAQKKIGRGVRRSLILLHCCIPFVSVNSHAQVCASPSSGFASGQAKSGVDHHWTYLTDDNGYTQAAFIAQMQTYNSTDTASVRSDGNNIQFVHQAMVKIEEEKSFDSETWHKPEVVGFVATSESLGAELLRDAADNVVGHLNIDLVNHNWETQSFNYGHSDLVIIPNLFSAIDLDPAHTRIRNVSNTGFDVKVEEWTYQDGIHTAEYVNWMAMEKGVHYMRDGQIVMVGEANVTQSTADVFTRINFAQSFPGTPVVFSHSQTFNGGHPMVTRMRNVTATGFDVLVEEQENQDNIHATESIGYIAVYGSSDVVTGNENPPVCEELQGMLGKLDLSANGGINPRTGNPWQVGDEYRLAFVTSQTITATSTNIETYNNFVQGAAVAAGLGAVDWKIIGSTSSVAARDNTQTNPNNFGQGGAIFAMDGSTKIADDNFDLWDNDVDAHISFDETGMTKLTKTFTGSNNNGTPRTSGRTLGGSSESPPRVTIGHNNNSSLIHWLVQYNATASSSKSVYALSEPLRIISSTSDADGDTVPDRVDAFPLDPTEYVDLNGDGLRD